MTVAIILVFQMEQYTTYRQDQVLKYIKKVCKKTEKVKKTSKSLSKI